MPCYHSKIDEEIKGLREACSIAICPLKTSVRGPAPTAAVEKEDIVDETLINFRSNVLFRNFEVRGAADRTLIYLTLYTHQCLVKCEKIDDKMAASRELYSLAVKTPLCPGDPGWPLGTLFPRASSAEEADLFKAYLKQARLELGTRLLERLFDQNGVKSKWWQAFSKRKFMGKELKE